MVFGYCLIKLMLLAVAFFAQAHSRAQRPFPLYTTVLRVVVSMAVLASPGKSASEGGGMYTRKRSRASLEGAVDNLLDGGINKTIEFVTNELKSRPHEVASFLANMLRDGEIEEALERKKAKAAVLGDLVPLRKGGTKLKHMGRRFDKEMIEELVGKAAWSDEHVEILRPVKAPQMCAILGVALQQHGETLVPTTHAYAKYEGPLKAVLRERGEAMQNRLRGKTAQQMVDLAHFVLVEGGEVEPRVDMPFHGKSLVFPFTDQQINRGRPWKIEHGTSLELGALVSSKGDRKHLKDLFSECFPHEGYPDETTTFESANAAIQYVDQLGPDCSGCAVAGAPLGGGGDGAAPRPVVAPAPPN